MKKGIILVIVMLVSNICFAGDSLTSTDAEAATTLEMDHHGTRMWNSDLEEYEGKGTMWVDCLAWATIQYGQYVNVRSLYSVEDVKEALKLALQHLKPSTMVYSQNAVYVSPADQLRAEADEIEQRDKDIDYIKSIFDALNN